VTTAETPTRGSLLEKLIAAVRPEFRVDVLIANPDDPVLGVKPCDISGCDRPIKHRGMCNGHHLRWKNAGSPDLATFKADQTSPPQMGRREWTRARCRGVVTGPRDTDCAVAIVTNGAGQAIRIQCRGRRRPPRWNRGAGKSARWRSARCGPNEPTTHSARAT